LHIFWYSKFSNYSGNFSCFSSCSLAAAGHDQAASPGPAGWLRRFKFPACIMSRLGWVMASCQWVEATVPVSQVSEAESWLRTQYGTW
jgi:hypothetical protein